MDPSKKAQLAEILYDLPTNKISTDLIRWAMSHLPEDTNERGKEATKPQDLLTIDHNKNALYEALGLSPKDVMAIGKKLHDSFPKDQESGSKSTILEKFMPQLNEKEKTFLVSQGIPTFQGFIVNFALQNPECADDLLQMMIGDEAKNIPDEQKLGIIEKMSKLKELMNKIGKLGGLGDLLK